MQKIVIQGVQGAFHEIAARQFFGCQIEVVPALSFPELFGIMASSAHADGAVLAIENSIAGSILGNYALLQNSQLAIVGEVYLPIRQNLLTLPGATLEDVQEVHSHPMALAQCAEFFNRYPHIRLVASEDTAESAAFVARNRSTAIGAIASERAAELYGLQILAPAIETVPENYTRFLALQRRPEAAPVPAANKVSLSFTLANEPGSLARILGLMAAENANLSKIQSVPLLGKPWEYHFYADFTCLPERIHALLQSLSNLAGDLQILGVYRSGSMFN
ncbi:MAG TPA: prephenate dehydratase [Saprospiraceae bacterium]|nr:prephenate dehydratase [Saprospiraceae bacterium]